MERKAQYDPINMKHIFLLLIAFLWLKAPLQALDRINERLLQHAQRANDSTASLADMVDYLIEAADNQTQQAEVIYYWISENIRYDVEGLESGSYLTQKNDAWESRKGVCEDYAVLYQRMAELAGLDCYVVGGYAVFMDYSNPHIFDGMNHAWNIVKVSGRYLFVDPTWASGVVHTEGEEYKFEAKRKPYYVLIPVAAALPTHLPGDPMWQLREKPYSKQDFLTGIDPSNDESVPRSVREAIQQYHGLNHYARQIRAYTNICKFNPTDQNLTSLIIAYQQAGYALLQNTPSEADIKRAALCYKRSAKLIPKIEKPNIKSLQLADAAETGLEYAQYIYKNGK